MVKRWTLNSIFVILCIPLLMCIVDAWTVVVFDYSLILAEWNKDKFVTALILAGTGLFFKIASIWLEE